jgi:CRISPR type III-A-associated RAMP protein Csm4
VELPFRCSSAFLAKDDLLFAPKPRKPLPASHDWSELFKVKFISMDNLKRWLSITPVQWDDKACKTFIKSIQTDDDIYKRLFINRVRAVNAKDRLHNQTQVFHRGETIYTRGTELYFLLDVSAAYEQQLRETIDFLTELAGFGGEINIGFSKMNSVKWQPFSLPVTNNKNVYLMSLYPAYPEVNWAEAWYDIINRKSWFNSPFTGIQMKKRSVRMVVEGSCLPSLPKGGELLDVSPGEWKKEKNRKNWHRIYRYGYAYFLNY